MSDSKDKKVTRSTSPGGAEDELILGHEYDGIREYDNPLPKWWTWIFIGTIVFSIGYFGYYELGGGEGIYDEYQAEVAAFEAEEAKRLEKLGDVTEDMLAGMMKEEHALAEGKKAFVTNCVQCHGESGEGKIGPNLTDAAWIHGEGKLMGIYKIVSEGYLPKGMPPWKDMLGPMTLRSVVAYVGSIRNTNVPGKEPEGEVPGAAASSASPEAGEKGAGGAAEAGSEEPSDAGDGDAEGQAGGGPQGAADDGGDAEGVKESDSSAAGDESAEQG